MGPYPPSFPPSSAAAHHQPSPSSPPLSSSPCKRERSPNDSNPTFASSARSVSLAVDDGGRRKGPWEALQNRSSQAAARGGTAAAPTVGQAPGLPAISSAGMPAADQRYDGLPAQQTASPNFFTSRRPVGSPAAAALGHPPPQHAHSLPASSSSASTTMAAPIQRTNSPSLGLSRLSLPDGSVNQPFAPGDASTPSVRSPALSFLSAFSSPPASAVAAASPPPSLSSAATSIIVSPDDAGQPAGGSGATEVLGKLLGKGTSGVVREVVSASTGERVQPPLAVKTILLRPRRTSPDEPETAHTLAEIEAEVALWQALPAHEALLPLVRHEVTQDAVYLFMPFMPHGSLFDVVRRHKEHDRGRGRPRLFSSSRSPPVHISQPDDGAGNKAFPHDDARRYFGDVARGLAAMHAAGIVHGDLKCENVLVNSENHCRLSDFGFSVRSSTAHSERTPRAGTPMWSATMPASTASAFSELNPRAADTHPAANAAAHHPRNRHLSPQPRQVSSPFPIRSVSSEAVPVVACGSQIPPGSLPYTAPELLRPSASPQPAQPTPATDVWALGVLLFFLVTSGGFPFADAFEPRLQLKIIRGVWTLPDGIEVGKECLSVLRGCLESDVGQRWSAADVLASEWLDGWEEVKGRSRSRSRARSNTRGRGSRSRSRASGGRIDGSASGGGFRPSTSMDRLAVAHGLASVGSPSAATESSEASSFPPTPGRSMSPPAPHLRRPKSLAQVSTETPTFSPSPSRSRSRSRGRSSRSRRDPSPVGIVAALSSLAAPADGGSQERSLSRGRSRNPSYHEGHEALGRGRPHTPSALTTFPEEEPPLPSSGPAL